MTGLHFKCSRVVLLAVFVANNAVAQPISDAELTRRQALQQEQAQSRAAPASDVFTPLKATPSADFTLVPETPCFTIREVDWQGQQAFGWIAEKGALLRDKCVGALGLRAFQDHLTRQLIARGYITSRVLIPEQNLSGGRLQVQVIPGRIGQLVDQGDPPGLHRTVWPAASGDLLNQRDLDQALENIRRLPSQQAVEFDLVPGAKLGDTDLLIKHAPIKRWRGSLSLDNSGAESTGKYQLGGVLSVDSPLHLYDSLTLSLNSNADVGNSALGTRASSLNWSVPLGYWSFLVGANQSSYKQTVAAFAGNNIYGGRSHGLELGVGYVAYRTSTAKGSAQVKLNRKVSRSHIDDVEIEVQYRDVVGYELSFSHRHYIGARTVELGLGIKGSLPGQSSAPGLIIGAPEWDGRYQFETAHASLTLPFRALGQTLRYQASLRFQHASTLLPVFELFSIGNRYSVRGFDGAATLAAENGVTWRNDLTWSLGASGQELYLALDAGRVGGSSAASLLGKSLAGAALGWRGRWSRFNYDMTVGRALSKPAGFNTSPSTVTVSAGADF